MFHRQAWNRVRTGADAFSTDLRRAARRLARAPGLSATAIVTLAVGIGMCTAMFSIVRSVLLRPMGMRAPDRLVVMWPTVNDTAGEFTHNAYRDIASAHRTLDGVTATGSVNWPLRFVLDGQVVTLHGTAVSSTFFDVMGSPPALGRTFGSDDDVPGARPVVVISDGLWAKYFNRDPAVIGQTVEVQEDSGTLRFEIVGVADAAFFYPKGSSYWTPVVPSIARSAGAAPLEPMLEELGAFHVIGRLRPAESRASVFAEADGLLKSRNAQGATGDARLGISVTPLVDHTFGRAREALRILMVAVLLVLASACANVAGLLIARGAARAHEAGVRAALGATRWALGRQALAEGLLLALAGSIVGGSLAAASLQGLIALSPVEIPRLNTTSLDGGVLAFAIAITVGSALLLTLAPALAPGHVRPLNSAGPHKGSVGRSTRTTVRHALVVLQVATGLVLLVATGLTMRSFAKLSSVDTGFRADNVLVFSLGGLDGTRYPDRQQRQDIATRAVERFSRLPGVESAAAVLLRPFGAGSIGWDSGLWLAEQGSGDEVWRHNPTATFEVVTPGYFRTMGISVRRGRDFQARDSARTPPVAIVSENLAARLWPGADPVGKRLVDSFTRGDGSGPPAWLTVVGVVGNAVYREVERPRFDLYLPLGQSTTFDPGDFVVATSGDPRAFQETLAAAARAEDSLFSLTDVATLDEIIASARGPWRFNMLVFGLFGAVSTALTTLGLFSLVSHTVTQRGREFGIRLALGAEPRRVWRMVLGEGTVLAAVGLAAGAVVAALVTPVLAGLLFETSATDGASFAGASIVLASVALLACYIPARRAASTDPAIVLRQA